MIDLKTLKLVSVGKVDHHSKNCLPITYKTCAYNVWGEGIILIMCSANGRRRYHLTSSLSDWAHNQNDPCDILYIDLWWCSKWQLYTLCCVVANCFNRHCDCPASTCIWNKNMDITVLADAIASIIASPLVVTELIIKARVFAVC